VRLVSLLASATEMIAALGCLDQLVARSHECDYPPHILSSWQSLRAVRDGRVYAIDGNAYINRSGPRLVESAEILGRILWGALPEINVDEGAWMLVE
jgi:ABC-type hemin transport system substrate-binding protein